MSIAVSTAVFMASMAVTTAVLSTPPHVLAPLEMIQALRMSITTSFVCLCVVVVVVAVAAVAVVAVVVVVVFVVVVVVARALLCFALLRFALL
jgi:hypothetical protein